MASGFSLRSLRPPRGRLEPLLVALAVIAAVVTSGTLECELPRETALQERGAHLYGLMCAVCHGANGEGYKADHAPAITQQDFLASVTDDYLRVAVSDGRQGTTMSAWAVIHGGPLGAGDVEAVVAFLRSRAETAPAVLDGRAPGGDKARGEVVYARECARCHGPRGGGGSAESVGHPQLLSASEGFLRYAIASGRPGTPMPGFRATLGDQGIEDVIAALRAWQAAPPPPPAKRPPPARTPPLPLGPVPLNPRGPEPVGFNPSPAFTSATVIKRELDRGAKMAVLDARSPSDYVNEHIPGAVSVPFYDPSPYFDGLPKDAWIVCYCGCPHAESGQLAQKLRAHGFTKVTVLDEGLGFWKNKKYGTTTGALP